MKRRNFFRLLSAVPFVNLMSFDVSYQTITIEEVRNTFTSSWLFRVGDLVNIHSIDHQIEETFLIVK